jgi:zinc protease
VISFKKKVLDNGLTVILHEDKSSPMVAVNILYKVGSKHEDPEHTGFAHLFEHLMFSGSKHVDSFDNYMQTAGGENNAFTNADLTNFYDVVPAENLETVLWLESDRMLNLTIDKKNLDIQRKVVVEEFKETCLNPPYGDVHHYLSELCYKKHGYRWPTIGKDISHIEKAKLDEVSYFFNKYYGPNNAIICLTGNIDEDKGFDLVEKWFADIPARPTGAIADIAEPEQTSFRQKTAYGNAPIESLYLAFHTPNRVDEDFYACDLISDILCNGRSSRLYSKLFKEEKIVSHIDCYLTGAVDTGLLMIEAKPAEGYSLEYINTKIWEELELLKSELVSDHELTKVKNKVENSIVFSEMSIVNKGINLCFFESIGDIELINSESQIYQDISAEAVHKSANIIFQKDKCSELIYKQKNG